jgi:hypothetical protein
MEQGSVAYLDSPAGKKFPSRISSHPTLCCRTTKNTKANETIYGPILLGYPKETPKPPAKKDPVIKWI